MIKSIYKKYKDISKDNLKMDNYYLNNNYIGLNVKMEN